MTSYFEHPAISQSQLKCLLIHPRAWTNQRESELYFEEKKHFVIGSAVDYYLTQPDKEFSEKYHISSLQNKPSDTIKSVINQLFDTITEQFDIKDIGNITYSGYKLLILQCCDAHEYQMNWKEQTRINKICEHYEYWEDLKQAYGKTVISQEESDLIDKIVMSLRTHETTSKYFNKAEIKYQVPIYFDYLDVQCKALLDMVIFDRKNKTIQPIDIKTMGDYTLNFPKSLRKRRYDIQAAFYTEALKWLYPDYKILPFKFIVESTIEPGQPLVFTCNSSLLEMGKNGRAEKHLVDDLGEVYQRLQEIKGFTQLLKLYKYYSTNGFELDQVSKENNSELTLDWSGIIV